MKAEVNTFINPQTGESTPVFVEYEVFGPEDGIPLLLVMGLGGQMIAWYKDSFVQPLLDEGYRVIIFDNRDSGLSVDIPAVPSSPLGSRLKRMLSGVADTITCSSSVDNVPYDSGSIEEITKANDYDLTKPIYPQQVDSEVLAKFPGYPHHVGLLSCIGLAPASPPYELTDMAIDALNLLTKLNIDRCHIMGVSMGGFICQYMSALAPSRILSQTYLMSSTYSMEPGLQPTFGFLARLFIGRKTPVGDDPESWADHLCAGNVISGCDIEGKTFNGGRPYRDFAIEACNRALRPQGALRQVNAVDLAVCRDNLVYYSTPRVPTLLLHGSADLFVPAANACHIFNIAMKRYATSLQPITLTINDNVVDSKSPDSETNEKDKSEKDKEMALLSTNMDNLDFVGEEFSAEVKIDTSYTRLHIFKRYAHDLPDGFCDVILPKLFQHLKETSPSNNVVLKTDSCETNEKEEVNENECQKTIDDSSSVEEREDMEEDDHEEKKQIADLE